MRIDNGDCRNYVTNRVEFTGNNLFSVKYDEQGLYVVYSYGEHFPIYVYDDNRDIWLENSGKYSISTGKHQSQACPNCRVFVPSTTQELKNLIHGKR